MSTGGKKSFVILKEPQIHVTLKPKEPHAVPVTVHYRYDN
jgi:hypothetical protein